MLEERDAAENLVRTHNRAPIRRAVIEQGVGRTCNRRAVTIIQQAEIVAAQPKKRTFPRAPARLVRVVRVMRCAI